MQIVLATGNPGKLRELQTLLAQSAFNFSAQSDHGVPEAVEDGDTFTDNALIKARNASRHTGLAAIADDSGLAVARLDGRPGVYSARYAGDNASDAENVDKLLGELEGVPAGERGACFHCVIVMVQSADDPKPLICEGTWAGRIAERADGDNGFGYDPVFIPDGFDRTVARLPAEVKNRHSHRARALNRLRARLL